MVWILLLIGYVFIYVNMDTMSAWEKGLSIGMLVVTALLNVRSTITQNKDFIVMDDELIVRQTFSREKRYSLATIVRWTEHNYRFLGVDTGRKIILETAAGDKIQLHYDEDDSANFEKLSDYLNDNLSNRYEDEVR